MKSNKVILAVMLSSLMMGCGSGGSGSISISNPPTSSVPDTTPPDTTPPQTECESPALPESVNHTTVVWDTCSVKFITAGVYSRIKKLSNDELILVYSRGPDVQYKLSSDGGDTFGEEHQVSHLDGFNLTNSEFIELHNGDWLYAWNARPITQGTGHNYAIMTSVSKDKGQSWLPPVTVYEGGDVSNVGLWEPAMLQLPDGELQLYFANEARFPDSRDQEIVMVRSFDDGYSYSDIQRISYSFGGRDGMPVPVLLNNNTIVVSIEDNVVNGLFKPVTLESSLADNWNQAVITQDSDKRHLAVDGEDAIAANVYAGAPYLIQLSSGDTLLSTQSAEGRDVISNESRSVMTVYVGNEQARQFAFPTRPFSSLVQSQGSSLWNSLEVIDDNTIMATSSVVTGDEQPDGIYIATGHVIYPQ